MLYSKYRRIMNKLLNEAAEAEQARLSVIRIDKIYNRIDKLETNHPRFAIVVCEDRNYERSQMGLTSL